MSYQPNNRCATCKSRDTLDKRLHFSWLEDTRTWELYDLDFYCSNCGGTEIESFWVENGEEQVGDPLLDDALKTS